MWPYLNAPLFPNCVVSPDVILYFLFNNTQTIFNIAISSVKRINFNDVCASRETCLWMYIDGVDQV